MDTADADETHEIIALSSSYATVVNILGIAKNTSGSSTTGFFDGNWSNINATDRIFYSGGSSYHGAFDGAFARLVPNDVSGSAWDLRGRCAVRRSVVLSAE